GNKVEGTENQVGGSTVDQCIVAASFGGAGCPPVASEHPPHSARNGTASPTAPTFSTIETLAAPTVLRYLGTPNRRPTAPGGPAPEKMNAQPGRARATSGRRSQKLVHQVGWM